MLAKYWKRIGLIILVIACLFNITFKLVNKTSLKVELQSIVGGESLSSIFSNKDEEQQSEYIEGVQNVANQVENETSTIVVY